LFIKKLLILSKEPSVREGFLVFILNQNIEYISFNTISNQPLLTQVLKILTAILKKIYKCLPAAR